MSTDVVKDIKDLLDPDKGFIVRRAFLTPEEVDVYRNECWEFLKTTRRVYKTIHRYCRRDYVWSTDRKIVPGVRTYRIYQALQAKHCDHTRAIFDRMLSLRNQIEANWLHDKKYRDIKMRLCDYVQATSYGKQSKGIAKHSDYKGDAPYPLLQPLIFLSQPGIDYTGGDLIIYKKSGDVVNVHKNLQLSKGDALLFDRSLYHEVQPTEPSEASTVGRWTVVVGARYPQPPSIFQRAKGAVRPLVLTGKRIGQVAVGKVLGVRTKAT